MPRKLSDLTDAELIAIATGAPALEQLSDEQLAGLAVQQGYWQELEAQASIVEKKKAERAAIVEELIPPPPTDEQIQSLPVEAIESGFTANTLARVALTRGGRAGDVAAQVLAPIAGAVAGSFASVPVAGTMVGGAAGGAAGDTLAQTRQYLRGERDDVSGGEITAASLAGGAPLGGPLLKGPARTIATRAVQGGAIAAGADAVGQVIDTGTVDLQRLAATGALGLLFGGAAGGVESAVVRKQVLQAIRRTPEFAGFEGSDRELVDAVRRHMNTPNAPESAAVKPGEPAAEAAPIVPEPRGGAPAGAEAEFAARAGMSPDAAAQLAKLSDEELLQVAQQSAPPAAGARSTGSGPSAAAEIPREIPASEPAPVTEKVIDVAPEKRKGSKPGFSPREDGATDLIDIVQELGGVPKPGRGRGGEFDQYEDIFRGPLKTLVDEKSHGGVDLFLESVAERDPSHRYGNAAELGAALEQAVASRQQLTRALAKRAYQQKIEMALFDNKGRSKEMKAASPVSSDDVVVGSSFRVHGELMTAIDLDPDNGALTLRGGTTLKVPPGTALFPDRGQIEAPPLEASTGEVMPFEDAAEYGTATPGDTGQPAAALLQKRMIAARDAGNVRRYLALRRQWLRRETQPPLDQPPTLDQNATSETGDFRLQADDYALPGAGRTDLPPPLAQDAGGAGPVSDAGGGGGAKSKPVGIGIGIEPGVYLADPLKYAGELRTALATHSRVSSIAADYFAGVLPSWSPAGKIIRNAADVVALMEPLRNPHAESMKVVVLGKGNRVMHAEVVHVGDIQSTHASLQSVLRVVAKTKFRRVIVSHNHPSGDPSPSAADWHVHDFLNQRLADHGIALVDNVVTNGHAAYSLTQARLFGLSAPVQSVWEHAPRNRLMVLDSPELTQQVATELRQSNPESSFLLFLTRKQAITAIEQVPANLAGDALRRLIEAGSAREGAAAVVIAARTVAKEISRALRAQLERSGVVLLDVVTDLEGSHAKAGHLGKSSAPQSQQLQHSGSRLMREDAPEYGGELDPAAPLVVHSRAKPNDYAKVNLAHLPNIKIVQMPEIVRLVRELTGEMPLVKKLGGGTRGHFDPAAVRIRLDPRIFRDPIAAAKTLAHEFGHLKDFLPTGTLKRGNLLGHLFALNSFMQGTFGGAVVDNAMIRAELKALTRWWKPFDADTAKDWYVKYRYSAAELYADAISVLFNSPAELKAHAPHFWTELFRALDRRPEVKTRLLEMWDFLNKPHLQVLQRRSDDIRKMFVAGDEIWLNKAAEREARYATFRGWSDRFRAELFDTFDPLVRRATKIERQGGTVPAKFNPRLVFDEHPLADNRNYEMLQHLWEGVVEPVEAEGYTLHELGEYLFLQRVLNERFDPALATVGRTEIANPLGMMPETARLGLLRMRLQGGGVRFGRLEAAAAKFHDIIFEQIREAVEVGAYSSKAFKEVLAPNKSLYATFAVLDHLQEFVPAGIRMQEGTFKEIANPFTATVLKTITLNRLIQQQRSKWAAVDFLKAYDPTKVTPAPRTFDGRQFHVQPPTTPDLALLELLEDGKRAGFHVDPAIVEMFEKLPTARMSAVLTVLNWPFRKLIYPLIIKYNPAFQLVLSPLKDMRRTWVNLPRGKGLVYAGEYVRNYLTFLGLPPTEAGAAVRAYLRGEPHPLIAEMIATQAIGTPLDNFAVDLGRGDKMEQLLRDFGLLPAEQQDGVIRTILTPLRALAERLEFAGLTFEMLPKVTSYKLLTRDLGWDPREAAYFARNSVGVPNIYKKGRQVQLVDAVLPFFKVFVNGTRNDIGLALKPKTAGGWWFRWAASDGIWTMLQAAAAAGLLGAGLKELYDGVSDYNKSNYNVIPVGSIAGGQYGKRVVYVRIPRDELHRWMSGLLYQGMMAAAGEASKPGVQSVVGFGTDQMPGLNPVLKIASAWKDYLEGENPMDGFRGRPVLTNSEWLAGGWAANKKMIGYTLQNAGVMNFVRWDSRATSTAEMTLSAVPGINRFIQTTDTGYRERQEEAMKAESRQSAEVRQLMPDNVQTLLGEYYWLTSVKKELRTLEQTQRLMVLKRWRTTIYQHYEDAAGATVGFGGKPDREMLRGLETATKAYERGR